MAGLMFTVVGGLQFCWRNVSAVLVEPSVIEPIDPFGGDILDLLDGPPRAPVFDQLGLVQTVDRLGERALSNESPTLPTEAEMPASARCSENRTEVY